MPQKYTKFCNAQILMRAIDSGEKDEQAMHILLSVFKKPLNWVQQRFGREGLFDAVHRLQVCSGATDQPLAWLFIIKEGFSHYDMPFYESEFITFSDWNTDYVQFRAEGVFAVLTQQHVRQIVKLHQYREVEAIKKFAKASLFYPYYLEQQHVQDFISLIRIKRLGYGKTLNWKDEDGSHKIGVVYQGLLSVEYQWKRNIEVTQLTKRKYITNKYVKDQLEEIEELDLEELQSQTDKIKELPKFRYVSKSDETIVLLFNTRLVKEAPYNVNLGLLPLIKKDYQKYCQSLQRSIGVSQFNKLYRNKSSIKENLKKKQARQTVRRNISLQISKTSMISSPILRTFATLELDTNPFDTVRTLSYPEPSKQHSKALFTSISPKSQSKLHRSKTVDIQGTQSHRRLVHNTWVEGMSKIKTNNKSFSTLQTLNNRHPQRQKKYQQMQQEMQKQEQPEFFMPNQFVKQKLRLKYEGLVNKVRHMDLTIKRDYDQQMSTKMERLESYVDSRRIVKLNNTKRKFRLLRDKVQY